MPRSELEKRKAKSVKQERSFAKRVGARLTPGSGSGRYQRNDARKDDALIENKRTDNEKSIRLVLDDLTTLAKRADQQGLRPVMQVEIGVRRYVVLREADYLDLVDDNADG